MVAYLLNVVFVCLVFVCCLKKIISDNVFTFLLLFSFLLFFVLTSLSLPFFAFISFAFEISVFITFYFGSLRVACKCSFPLC